MKKTPAKVRRPKGDDGDFSSKGLSQSERRKSGRGVIVQKGYADRDSSDDDEEMLDGVAKWDYFSEDPDSPGEAKRKRKMPSEAPSESEILSPPPEDGNDAVEEVADEDVQMSDAEPEVVEAPAKADDGNDSELSELEDEPADEPQPEEEEEEEEVVPTPPRSNGKKTPRSSAKKATPKSTPKLSAKPKAKPKGKPALAKPKPTKAAAKPVTKGTRSSGRTTRASGDD